MDPSKINWRLVGAVLAALGYVAYRNRGLKHFGKALEKNALIGAVLGIVAYFGLGVVLQRVQASVPSGADLPPQGQAPALNGYYDQGMPVQSQGQMYHAPGPDPDSELLGC